MDEKTLETTVDTESDNWDDITFDDAPVEADTPPDEEADAADSAPESEPADQPDKPKGEAEPEPEAKEAGKQTDQFVLKHLDDTRTVSRDEVITLAQKGMDYDRIRQKLDEQAGEKTELEGRLRALNDLAAAGGFKTADDLLEDVQASMLAVEKGIDKAEEKRNADFAEFLSSEYKGEAEKIPKEVWDSYNKGGVSLLQAFRAYDNHRLKVELEALKKSAENKARSTGSLTTTGKPSAQDEFDRAWNDGT